MRGRKKWNVGLFSGESAALMVLGVCFLVGTVLGCASSGVVCVNNCSDLLAYVREYMVFFAAGEAKPALGMVLWKVLRLPLSVFLLGFTFLGLFGIPVLFLIRGFLLSFAVSSFYHLFGIAGGVPAFILFGLSALVWLPVLLHLGIRGMLASYSWLRRGVGDGRQIWKYDTGFIVCFGMWVAAFCFAVLLEYLVVPELVRIIAVSF